LIILEGPDGAGKTTLARSLVANIQLRDPGSTVELFKCGPPSRHPLDEYVTPLLTYQPGSKHHVICDRWHLGETVYPDVLNRPTKMTPAILEYIRLFLRSKGAYVARIIPLWTELEKRIGDRPELLTVKQRHAAYFRWTSMAHGVAFRDVGPGELMDYARTAEGLTAYPAQTYVGDTMPELLIVGDVRHCAGGEKCTHYNRKHSEFGAAFMPYPSTSGLYLMNALTEAGLPRERYGVVNACDVDKIAEVWWSLGCPRVVTLGTKAHGRLEELKIKHGAVPHPQFIRRFHHKALTDYGKLVLNTAHTGRNELAWRPTSTESTVRELTTASSTGS
jgi:hypothetical protein